MTITEVLNEIGKRVVQDLKASLIQKKKLATGNLYKSIEYKVDDDTMEVLMLDYWRWVDEGRLPGTYPPVKEIIKWLKVKGANPKYPDTLKSPSATKAAAFLVARKIYEDGIKESNFYSQVEADYLLDDIDAAIDQYLDSIEF